MSILYFNGDIIVSDQLFLSHKDCGFTTGIGIFDSMLAIDAKRQHCKNHYDRLCHDTTTVIGLPFPHSFGLFQTIIQNLLLQNECESGYARIRTTVTGGIVEKPLAGAEKLSILIDVAPCTPPPETPIKCAIIKDYPRIAGCALENCKRLDYSRSYAARRQAEKLGAEEAILTNTDGNIACAATSNIFIEENGILITPPLSDGVLAGVTRKNILSSPPEMSSPFLPSRLRGGKGGIVREESISFERLKGATKIYLTNSFIGLREVILI